MEVLGFFCLSGLALLLCVLAVRSLLNGRGAGALQRIEWLFPVKGRWLRYLAVSIVTLVYIFWPLWMFALCSRFSR